MIRSLIAVFIILLMTVLISAINLFWPPMHSWFMIIWAQIVLKLAGVKLVVQGKDNLPLKGPGVVVINHESALDIPMAVAGLKIPVRFMAKRALFKVPIFGWCLYLCNHIPIDRSNPKKAIAAINKTSAKIFKKGCFVIVSPEGTRSYDGKIGPFKKGAFRLADKEDIPVIPVTLMGSRYCVPNKTLRIVPGEVIIDIEEPVYIHQYADINACILDVRSKMIKRKTLYERNRQEQV